jgi:hypothetical protein
MAYRIRIAALIAAGEIGRDGSIWLGNAKYLTKKQQVGNLLLFHCQPDYYREFS